MLDCMGCHGTGQYSILSEKEVCRYCSGTGTFESVNESDILNLITATRGKNKGKLRSSMSSPYRSEGVTKNRAYYVWRMARFHAGVDVTMPVMATLCIRHDPYSKELDALADKVAADCFGTNMAATYRWGRALGLV